MCVEKAGMSDVDALVELRLAYLTEDHGQLDDGEIAAIRAGLPSYFRAYLNQDLFAFVMREGQTIVSCALLLIIEKPLSPAFINGRTGTVLNVYTLPSHRRRGHARKLMEAVLEEAREQHLSVVDLKATEDGYPLYRKVGFADDQSSYHDMKWLNPEIA